MWEIALLIIAVGFILLVLFTIPVLLQLRDSAKEMELTLRETREAVKKLREISGKAEIVLDQGRGVVQGAHKAVLALDGILGREGMRTVSKTLQVALEFFPVFLAATKIIRKHGRR
jgi:hypothetical protein